jgi:hypothetical protein
MAKAMPACQGAPQDICGVWSGISTPVEMVFLQDGATSRSMSTSPSSMNVSLDKSGTLPVTFRKWT